MSPEMLEAVVVVIYYGGAAAGVAALIVAPIVWMRLMAKGLEQGKTPGGDARLPAIPPLYGPGSWAWDTINNPIYSHMPCNINYRGPDIQ